MSKNILPRVCKECGNEFLGGPRAWYCPVCRAERKKMQHRDFKKREKSGAVVPIGSVIQCEICGKEIIKNGGLQRYCEDCAKIHLKNVDNAQSLDWKRKNPQKIKESKRIISKKRHKEEGKKSGFTGVTWDKGKRLWIAKIYYEGKPYIIMRTKDLDLAIGARIESEKAIENGNFEKWIEEQKNN